MSNKYKLKLNSVEKLESLLQEIYEEANRQINLIQNKISELEESTNLSDESIDMKAKYAKAIHDYITDRDKALMRKMDVSKLMSEVLKYNGDIEKVMSDKDIIENLDDQFRNIRETMETDSNSETTDNTETYITNK